MNAKPEPEERAVGGSGRLMRQLVVVASTLAAVGALVWGIAWLGDEARRGMGARDRYRVHFADLVCDSPPGIERAAFLSEVRYVSNLPESFQSLDPELQQKLTAAFTRHPWVAKVEGVSVSPNGSVEVKLRFRVPVLAVHPTAGSTRFVDASGVLLPPEASASGVPELANVVQTAIPLAGQTWADPDVKRALELVEAHQPRRLEKTPSGWRLTTTDGKTLGVES